MADGLLSLEAVGKSYWRGPAEVRVLTDASLDINPGEFVAVWGKRGAGKADGEVREKGEAPAPRRCLEASRMQAVKPSGLGE